MFMNLVRVIRCVLRLVIVLSYAMLVNVIWDGTVGGFTYVFLIVNDAICVPIFAHHLVREVGLFRAALTQCVNQYATIRAINATDE